MGFCKKTRSGSGSGSDFIKKIRNPTRNPARNPVIYLITKIPSYIYILINPNISHSSFHFSIQLPRLSSLQLTPPPLISSAHNLTHSQSHRRPNCPTFLRRSSSHRRPKLSQLSHSLSHMAASPSSSLSSLTHTATSPQVVKHRHNSVSSSPSLISLHLVLYFFPFFFLGSVRLKFSIL